MEASEQTPPGDQPQQVGTGAEGEPHAPAGEPPEDERNPAPDQSPVATERSITGDPGLTGEQDPIEAQASPDTPARTSPPPPGAQSGVPLPEDRAAGVEPGPPGPRPTEEERQEAADEQAQEGDGER